MSTNYYNGSRVGSEMGDSEMGSAFEMKKWPSYYSGSQASMTYSHRSFYSTYTPSYASTFLPIVQQGPDKLKKPDDNFGLACISIFINPIFGIIAVLLAGKLTDILHEIFIIYLITMKKIPMTFRYNVCLLGDSD